MAMEHRWGRRIAVDLSVTLHCRPTGRLRGRLRDLSSGGAFVQIPAFLTPNARVEMVFTVKHGRTAQIHRFETAVSRVAANGIGLMFVRFDPKALSKLMLHLEHDAALRLLTAPRAPAHGMGVDRPARSSNTNEAK